MAADRIITTGFWDDPDFEDVPYLEKFLYIYLFSAQSSAICGYFLCTFKKISESTGMPIELVKDSVKGLDKRGKIIYDSGFVFVKGMAYRQKSEKKNWFINHCKKQYYDGFKPENRAFEAFVEFFSLKECFSSNSNEITDKKEEFPKESLGSPEEVPRKLHKIEIQQIEVQEIELQESNSLKGGVGENFTTQIKPSLEECILYFEIHGFSEAKKQGELFYNHYFPFERDDGRPFQEGKWKMLANSWNIRKPDFDKKLNGRLNGKQKHNTTTTAEDHAAGW